MANVPFERVEDVHLHLREHAGVVQATAHVVELVDLRHAVLLVTVLGGNEESGTADKLVVLLVHNTLGAVAVQQVDGQEQGLGKQAEGGVGLDDKVNQVWAHKPLNLALHIDEGDVRQRLVLHVAHVPHNVLEILLRSQARQLVGNHLLAIAGKHLGSIAGGQAGHGALVGLDKECLILDLVVSHGGDGGGGGGGSRVGEM